MLYKDYYANVILLIHKNKSFLLKTIFFNEIIPLNMFRW